MRVINILKENKPNNKVLVTIETLTDRSFLGIKLKPIKRIFVSNNEYMEGYWDWVEMPNKISVDDLLKFQLDINLIHYIWKLG